LSGGDDDKLGGGRPHGLVEVSDHVDLHAGVVRILMSLRPIPLDQQPVVGICLDVEVALARKADHLHRQVVVDPLVEKHFAAQRSDLRALVADDRAVQPYALHPWQGPGKWTPRAGHDGAARPDDASHRFHVARVQLEGGAENRAIEVEGQESIRRGKGYLFTSGFRRLGGRPPRTAVAMLRAAIADISDRVRTVPLAMCGARTTLARAISPG